MKVFFISLLNMIPGLMKVLTKLSNAVDRVSKLLKVISGKLDFIARKVMFLVWVVTVAWLTLKPVNVDADLQGVKLQCADPKDVVMKVGSGFDDNGRPTYVDYYFGCSVQAGKKSKEVVQPIDPAL